MSILFMCTLCCFNSASLNSERNTVASAWCCPSRSVPVGTYVTAIVIPITFCKTPMALCYLQALANELHVQE